MLSIFENIAVIIATVAGTAGVLLLFRRFWQNEMRRQHNDLIGWHISVLGSTYAVIIGFMLFAVWSNFETAESNVEAEANCLVNVVRSARGLSAAEREQVRHLASEYVRLMLTEEWPAMERGEVSPASHLVIEKLWITLTGGEAHGSLEQTSLDHSLTELARMTEYRRLRQLQVTSYLPEILWFVLIAGAAVTIISACLFGTVDIKLHLIQVMMLALMISSALVAIADINRPFQGSAYVNVTAFERARVTIAESN